MPRPTSQRTVVSRLFAASPRPIYLLDASRRITYCNDALASWVARPIEDLLGLQCIHVVGKNGDMGELARQLSPPPQTLDESFFRSSLVISAEHALSRREASFYLLSDDVDTTTTLVIVDSLEADDCTTSAFDAGALHRQLLSIREQWADTYRLDTLLGDSSAMQQVRRQTRLAAGHPCPVVVCGKPGCGREHIARTIHRERSGGRRSSLVPLSCHLLDDELIEVALQSFQYEQEEAGENPPALLLLEVDQLPVDAQARLLEFLQSSPVEVETLATSQSPLRQVVAPLAFRADLAHRLVCLEIQVPSLMDRLDDVPLLAQWFTERSRGAEQRPIGGFTPDAIEALIGYRWPGEVAELQAVVEQAVESSSGTLIDANHLPSRLALVADAESRPPRPDESVRFDDFLAEIESELIMRAIKQSKGNKAMAARLLHISRAKLLRRIVHLGIEG